MDAGERDVWRQADRALDALLDLPPPERVARLQAMPLAPAVLARVQRLLAAHEQTEGPLDRQLPPGLAVATHEPQALSGRRLGRWQLDAEIGRGGMAVVYRAQALEGATGQVAAVKVLTLGALAGVGRERFLREQQALLRLRHPYIVPLYDAGIAEDGTPWLAMALVDGVRIDDWCARHALGIDARVQLLQQVGEALSYAHRNLVIHRDIKPSNVLVDDDGHVRLLDFGIARLGDEVAAEATATHLRALTPEYAAPEQFQGAPPSTAMDVYGLGALLYRLLTGRAPRAAGHDVQVAQLLTPSRASQITSSEFRPRMKRGDLDTVVMKTLSERSEDRYASVEAFMDDLQRWLAKEPILAHPPSRFYRLRKFAQRRKAAVLAGTAALVLAVLAVSQIVVQRNRAEDHAQRAEAVRDFLADVFESTDPSVGEVPSLLDVLNEGSRRAREDLLRDQPQTAADVLLISGGARNALSDYEKAESDLLLALPLLEQRQPAPAEELSRAHWNLGLLYKFRGENDKWLKHDHLAVHWVHRWKNAPAEERLSRELSLAAAIGTVHPEQNGEALIRKVLAGIPAAGLANTQLHMDALNALSSFLARNNRELKERIALHEQRIAVARTLYGEESGWYAFTLADAVPTLRKSPAYLQRAEAAAREAIAISDRVFREPHMTTAVANCNMGALLLLQRGDSAGALPYYNRAIAIDEALERGDVHAQSCRFGRAKARAEQGDFAGALIDLAKDRAMLEKLDKQRSPQWLSNCGVHVGILLDTQQQRSAARLLDQCEAQHRPDHGELPADFLEAHLRIAAERAAAVR